MTDYSAHLKKAAAAPHPGDLVAAFGSYYRVSGYDGKGFIRIHNARGTLTIWATRLQPDGGHWTVHS